jgi:hypothetical protein
MTVVVSSRWLEGIVVADSDGQAMIASAAEGGDAASPRGDEHQALQAPPSCCKRRVRQLWRHRLKLRRA